MGSAPWFSGTRGLVCSVANRKLGCQFAEIARLLHVSPVRAASLGDRRLIRRNANTGLLRDSGGLRGYEE
jgi:hypothetical protein